MHLTLASQSPRRRQMLADLGIPLLIRPANTDETPRLGELPHDYVRRVAMEKVEAVDGEIVLAADTVVVLAGQILGKPESAEDARRMLRQLSGQIHTVLTGVGVRRKEGLTVGSVVATQVHFALLPEIVIDWYVGTGEPFDKAGAYAVQGAGGAFVREISGSVSNVVGLPLTETLELLQRAGYRLPWEKP